MTAQFEAGDPRGRRERQWLGLPARWVLVGVLALVALVLFLVTSLAGAGAGGGGVTGVGGGDPGDVVRDNLVAANEGDYTTANRGLADEVIQHYTSRGGSLPEVWDDNTRNRTMKEVEILGTEINGDTAEVEYRITYDSGRTDTGTALLTRQRGQWKETFSRD